MSTTAAYLQQHYLDLPAYAAAAGCSPERVRALVVAGVIPAPTYRIGADDVLVSVVFGELPARGAPPGDWFAARNLHWLQQALRVPALSDAERAACMRAQFVSAFAEALAELNTRLLRLPECFDKNGAPLADGLAQRTDTAWQHHLAGIFGLCVTRPDSVACIAEKELLQEKLSALTDNGQRGDYPPAGHAALRQMIADYAERCMPFSPDEYPRSSRKRLVEQPLAALANATA